MEAFDRYECFKVIWTVLLLIGETVYLMRIVEGLTRHAPQLAGFCVFQDLPVACDQNMVELPGSCNENSVGRVGGWFTGESC